MITKFFTALLASTLFRRIGKIVVIGLLEIYAESTDTEVDDKAVADIKAALAPTPTSPASEA